MTSQNQSFSTPTASPLRVGARIGVVIAVCAALTVGFVGSLTSPTRASGHQVARAPLPCTALTC